MQAALPKVKVGLAKYLDIQQQIASRSDFHTLPDFRRAFNGFYRVRFGDKTHYAPFYELMGRGAGMSFPEVLNALKIATGELHASFSSKLLASLDPTLPVWDTWVIQNLGLRTPYHYEQQRAEKLGKIYQAIRDWSAHFRTTDDGRTLVREFREAYPTANITEAKMVDLVLWQMRGDRVSLR